MANILLFAAVNHMIASSGTPRESYPARAGIRRRPVLFRRQAERWRWRHRRCS